MESRLQSKATIRLGGPNAVAEITFDLSRTKMTTHQRDIVNKLFSQNPHAMVAEFDHSHASEQGKDGPASKYLTQDEFNTIRQLGVRLGTSGIVAMTACDFCLHCVKLEPMPQLGEAVEK